MDAAQTNPTPWYAWPFVIVWRFVTGVLKLTGRMLGIIVGVMLLIVGVALSLTVIGAIIGIPLAILGIMLIVRALF